MFTLNRCHGRSGKALLTDSLYRRNARQRHFQPELSNPFLTFVNLRGKEQELIVLACISLSRYLPGGLKDIFSCRGQTEVETVCVKSEFTSIPRKVDDAMY